jgi:hypothetical protein
MSTKSTHIFSSFSFVKRNPNNFLKKKSAKFLLWDLMEGSIKLLEVPVSSQKYKKII